MAGPWEQYQQQAGPWIAYQQQAPAQPALDPSQAPSFLDRVGTGARDISLGGAQLLVNALPASVNQAANELFGDAGWPTAQQFNEQIAQRERQYEAERQAGGQEGTDWGRLLGNAGVTALMSRGFGPSVLGGAAGGGMSGALMPVTEGDDYWSEKGKQTLLGGVLGGAGTAAINTLGRVVSPVIPPQVKRLMDKGVTPTPGQILGDTANSLEQRLTSVPVLGDVINAGRRRAVEDMNKAALQDVLDPIGEKLQAPVGREGVEFVRDKLRSAYDKLLPSLQFVPDNQFAQDVASLRGLASNMPDPQARQFEKIIQDKLVTRLGGGISDGQAFKGVESELSRLAKGYRGSASFDERQLGDAVAELLRVSRETLTRSNPQRAPELSAINNAYARYATLRDAAGRGGTDEGVFTAAQLLSAVRAGDKSVGKGSFATGNAQGQEFAEAAKSVLGSSYPDSGSAGRAIAAGGLLGYGTIDPAGASVAAALSLPYLNRTAQQVAASALTQRPGYAPALAEVLRQYSVPTSTAATAALLGNAP